MKIAVNFELRIIVATIILPCVVWGENAPSASNSSANGATTTGEAGMLLTKNLYCSTSGLLEGNIGLMLGLLLVFLGIWGLIRGGKMVPAIITILSGALVTALPSLTESAFAGIGNLLVESGLSQKGNHYTPPECGTAAEIREKNYEQDLCTGGYLDCS